MTRDRNGLLFRAQLPPDTLGTINRVTAEDAGWALLNAETRRMGQGDSWEGETGEHEVAIVLLGGTCSVRSSVGSWTSIGKRPDVFSGMPTALYLPRRTTFTVTATSTQLELAHCWVPTDQDHSAQLITPEMCPIEVRGGHNATRQINDIIAPGFACHRIVCCEVYTPGGNWSSYPPHKHDVHRESEDGRLLEADLEEFYIYKVKGPRGYAVQRVYTDDRSLDETVTAHDGDIVLVPEGYHPVSAAYGYDCYYLNFLAGTAQSLASADDPTYAWIKETWTETDPRVPMVTHGTQSQ